MVLTNIFKCKHLSEPLLLFGGSNPCSDPKLGLTLYGPYSWTKNTIEVGVIGDKDSIEKTHNLLTSFRNPIEGPRRHPNWTPDFPGFSDTSVFKTQLLFPKKWYQIITLRDLEILDTISSVRERISVAADIFLEHLWNL